MCSASWFAGLALWSGVAILALPLPSFSEPVRVTEMDFEVLEDVEALHVRSDGKLEIEVRELDLDTLSIELRGAVLDDRVSARIVPAEARVVRVVTATTAADARGPLLRLRIEHAPRHRPAIEPTKSGLSAVFARPESRDSRSLTVPRYRAVPVTQLIREVAAKNGETLLLADPIAQRISLLGPRELSPGEFSALLDTALLMKSRVAVPMPGGGRKIMNASGAPLPWVPELPEDPDDSPLVTLVRFKHVDSAALLGLLQPLLGRLTLGVAHEPTNSILLAGSAARVARLRTVMLALDEAPEEETLTFTLEQRGSDEILGALERIFKRDEIISAVSDVRTNTLLLRARASAVPRLRRIVERLDRKVDLGGRLHVFRVHYADPERLADQLGVLQAGSSTGRTRGAASLSGRSFSLVVDEPTSSLVLKADAATAQIVADLLAEIDVLPPRVRVDVTLVEVLTASEFEVGFDAFLPFGAFLDSGHAGGFVVSAPSPGGISALLAGNAGDGFVARMSRNPLVVPIVDALGNVMDVAIPREIFQLKAGESGSVARVMLNPTLLVSSGDEQLIFAGDNVPVPVAKTDAAGSVRIDTTIERYDTGTTLRVTPTVGAEGRVQLQLYVESSRLVPLAAEIVDRVGPSFVERVVETTVQLPSGALAVIGFAARPFVDKVEVGVPLLRSIPVLGLLFRWQKRVERKSTLLVAVRAQVENAEEQALSRALTRELALPLAPQGAPAPAAPTPLVSGRASPRGPAGGPRPVPRS